LTTHASLSRIVGFRALHRFYRPEWSEARNREAFGPLSDPPGHAHDYQCLVTVSGPLTPLHGMVMDLVALDRILHEEVVARFDGRHLNLDIPEFAYGRLLPTCEAIAAHVYPRVAGRLPAGVLLDRVRIAEDPSLYAECIRLP
jgi:6-pyruvoyltetrahydropterin/6-carboxytetrahydropterin synthase